MKLKPADAATRITLAERKQQSDTAGHAEFQEPSSDEARSQRGWPVVPLGEIAEVKLGRMLDKAKHRTGRRFPYLRNVNVRWGAIETDNLLEMHFEEDQLDRFGLKPNDVLVCEGGEPGRAAVWNGQLPDVKFQKALHRVRFKVPFEPRFLVYLLELRAKNGRLERRFTGSTIRHFTREAFVKLPVPLPPEAEQRRIVSEIEKQFTRLDVAVAALRRVQANLMRYRAAVLTSASGGRLVPTEAELARRESRAYEPAATLLNRVVCEPRTEYAIRKKERAFTRRDAENLSALPEGWTWAGMRQVGEVQLGRQRAPQHHTGDNMRAYLRVANVFEARIDLTDVKTMNFTPEEFKKYQLLHGDILLNEGQTPELVGRPAMFRGELPDCCFQKTLIRFRAYSGLLPSFALTVFRSYMYSRRFTEAASITTNIAHLTAEKFVEIEFPLPPLAEQTRIVAEAERRLSVVEKLEASVTASLQRASRLRQSILQKAFAGELITQESTEFGTSARAVAEGGST